MPNATSITVRLGEEAEYRVSSAGGNVILAQGYDHALPNPFESERFLLAIIPHPRAWLLVADSTDVDQESFSVHTNLKGVACIVGRDSFTGKNIELTVCTVQKMTT